MWSNNLAAQRETNPRVLVIDDDPSFTSMLNLVLEEAGYQVHVAFNGLEGIRSLYQWRPHLVVLDVFMPLMDGWQTCQRIREVSDVPILMLTGQEDEGDELRALREGVDLYMGKPLNVNVLLARLEALLRRSRQSSAPSQQPVVTVGRLRLDLKKQIVTVAGYPVNLSPTQFRLLAVLASQPGETIPRRELLVRAWGPRYAQELGHLKQYIWYLRRKIEPNPSRPRYIVTRRGVGYYLNDEDF